MFVKCQIDIWQKVVKSDLLCLEHSNARKVGKFVKAFKAFKPWFNIVEIPGYEY